MAKDLSKIQTVVIAMMENRSFDHLLGYLGLPDSGHPNAGRIEGVQHAQIYYAHDPYPPRPLSSPSLDPDPPHERDFIDLQINSLSGPMKGFVQSYRSAFPSAPVERVMEHCLSRNVPKTDILARNYALCDNWHACLPASTLPNRLMAMSGYALVDFTPDGYLEIAENLFYDEPDDLVYDWLKARGVSWRVYYSGSFFFMQMPRILALYEADTQTQALFRPIERLQQDFQNGDLPQVVFVEPLYEDDMRRGTAQATDDHPPASLWGGQRFVNILGEALGANQSVWQNLVAILTYDEHGSFFDHVKPPSISTDPPPNAKWKGGRFNTLGVRVPGIIVSPFAKPATVFETLLDHTSILKFLGDLYGGGRYTPAVDARPVGKLSDALDDDLLSGNSPLTPPPAMDSD